MNYILAGPTGGGRQIIESSLSADKANALWLNWSSGAGAALNEIRTGTHFQVGSGASPYLTILNAPPTANAGQRKGFSYVWIVWGLTGLGILDEIHQSPEHWLLPETSTDGRRRKYQKYLSKCDRPLMTDSNTVAKGEEVYRQADIGSDHLEIRDAVAVTAFLVGSQPDSHVEVQAGERLVPPDLFGVGHSAILFRLLSPTTQLIEPTSRPVTTKVEAQRTPMLEQPRTPDPAALDTQTRNLIRNLRKEVEELAHELAALGDPFLEQWPGRRAELVEMLQGQIDQTRAALTDQIGDVQSSVDELVNLQSQLEQLQGQVQERSESFDSKFEQFSSRLAQQEESRSELVSIEAHRALESRIAAASRSIKALDARTSSSTSADIAAAAEFAERLITLETRVASIERAELTQVADLLNRLDQLERLRSPDRSVTPGGSGEKTDD